MRGKELYEKITNIDDDIISDAGNTHKSKNQFISNGFPWWLVLLF